MLKRHISSSKLSIQSFCSHPSSNLLRPTKYANPIRQSARLLTQPASSSHHVHLSELGTRKTNPPDSLPDPTPDPEGTEEVDDIEWQIRSGRAIFVLQETLPTFFSTGLITSIDKDSGAPRPETPLTMHFPLTSIPAFKDHHSDLESIYSPNVRLSYTPPVALPAPFPKTLHIEGISLYLASSAFVRHTLNALYSDLKVVPTKMEILPTASPSPSQSAPASKDEGLDTKTKKLNRERSIKINLNVSGVGRVSGAFAEWDVSSTYTLSPLTGLILEHTVNSIHPSPHLAVYETLRKSFGITWGDGPRRGEPGVGVGGSVGCGGQTKR